MEPLVVDLLQLSGLFQTGIFVIDSVNQFLVIAYQTQFARRNVRHVGHQTVECELF